MLHHIIDKGCQVKCRGRNGMFMCNLCDKTAIKTVENVFVDKCDDVDVSLSDCSYAIVSIFIVEHICPMDTSRPDAILPEDLVAF